MTWRGFITDWHEGSKREVARTVGCHDAWSQIVLIWFCRLPANDIIVAMGKTPMQGVCAVKRKLCHALIGVLTSNQPVDHTRFHASPAEITRSSA